MTDPFKKPSEVESTGGEFAKFPDFVGETVLIQPTVYEDGLTGKFTKKDETYDRVTADVTVIDLRNPTDSVKHESMWITQGRIIGKTKGDRVEVFDPGPRGSGEVFTAVASMYLLTPAICFLVVHLGTTAAAMPFAQAAPPPSGPGLGPAGPVVGAALRAAK